MKYLKQFSILLTIAFIGEVLSKVVPFPVPASIYGLVILFILLTTKLLKLDQVKETGYFLIEIMPVMFIPAAVGLIVSWQSIQVILIQVTLITVISTVIVMVAAGRTTQWFVIRKEGKENERVAE
ncbi:MAG: CidA/LrgA family protein [Culicoidibacterales bacterium]